MRILSVGLRRGQQTHDRSRTSARGIGGGEQPVLPADRDGPNGVLDRVVIDRESANVEVVRECGPALEGVVDRGQRAARIEHLRSQCG